MAKKFNLGTMLAVGTVTAALGGVAAYINRKAIEKTVNDIAEKLDAQEEDGIYTVDMDDEPIVHSMDSTKEADESDFVDEAGEAEEMDAPAPEEAPVEEAPAEETAEEADPA